MAPFAQCVSGPATFVVTLAVGVLLVVGAILLGGTSRKREKPRDPHACAKCDHVNAPNAKFCAKCGERLREDTS